MTKEFENAVADGRRKAVYIMLKDGILEDPTAMQFDDMLSYASHFMGDIYESHNGEELKRDPEAWNQRYLFEQLERMVNNFSRERVALVKDMAGYLSENGRKKLSAGEESMFRSQYYIMMGIGIVVTLIALVLILQGSKLENQTFVALGMGLVGLNLVSSFYIQWKMRKKEEEREKENK